MSYNVGVPEMTVVQPKIEGYDHLGAFDEVSHSLVEGLVAMGIEAVHASSVQPDGGRHVLLAAHLFDDRQLRDLPAGTIVYNHEQIDDTSMLPPARLRSYGHVEIWDYSARNIAAWQTEGIDAAHVPIGWSPGLERITRSSVRPIDVLFYGSLNERRQRILEALGRGLRVEAVFGGYGAARDGMIAASKLVVNIQYYEARILEMVRLSYLFANAVPVVSEVSPGIDVPTGFDDAAAFAPYDRLVETTRALLGDLTALDELGERGREAMRAWPWSRCLAGVL